MRERSDGTPCSTFNRYRPRLKNGRLLTKSIPAKVLGLAPFLVTSSGSLAMFATMRQSQQFMRELTLSDK